jgi:Pyruvate/2-oxoacid:ferredoxin oxidoreductase gamma subunit
MLGALVAASGIVSLDAVKSAILQEMKESIQEKNVQVVKLAYDEAGRLE